jgi:hypothetical protein
MILLRCPDGPHIGAAGDVTSCSNGIDAMLQMQVVIRITFARFVLLKDSCGSFYGRVHSASAGPEAPTQAAALEPPTSSI